MHSKGLLASSTFKKNGFHSKGFSASSLFENFASATPLQLDVAKLLMLSENVNCLESIYQFWYFLEIFTSVGCNLKKIYMDYFSTNIYFCIIIANYVFAKKQLLQISQVLALSILAALPLKAALVKNIIWKIELWISISFTLHGYFCTQNWSLSKLSQNNNLIRWNFSSSLKISTKFTQRLIKSNELSIYFLSLHLISSTPAWFESKNTYYLSKIAAQHTYSFPVLGSVERTHWVQAVQVWGARFFQVGNTVVSCPTIFHRPDNKEISAAMCD